MNPMQDPSLLNGSKYEPQQAVDQIILVLRERVRCTNGLVIVVNDQTKEAFLGTVVGDINRTVDMLERTLASLRKVKQRETAAKGGIIVP